MSEMVSPARTGPAFLRIGLRELLLLLLPAALLLTGYLGVPWTVVAVVAVLGLLLLLADVQRRGGLEMLGPLYVFDLVRLARRGRTTLLRCLYALLLFGALYLVYLGYFPDYDLLRQPFYPDLRISLSEEAHFTRSFVTAVLLLQGSAVLVLTPAYLAGAIAEEKEQKTLEMLFTTHLRDREIVLGKLFGRLTHLAIILLTGLPVLMLVQLFGGVDVMLVLGGFAASLLSLLSIGSISILCSVMCRKVITAVLASYAATIAFSVSCLCMPFSYASSPVAFVLALSQVLGQGEPEAVLPTLASGRWMANLDPFTIAAVMLLTYAVLHGLVALVLSGLAISGVRWSHAENPLEPLPGVPRTGPPPVRVVAGWDPIEVLITHPVGKSEPVAAAPPASRVPERPSRPDNPVPIGDRPLLWKEVYHANPGAVVFPDDALIPLGLVALVVMAVIAGLFLLSYAMDPAATYSGVRTGLDGLLRGAFVALAGTWCVCLSFRAASSISSERDRRTLDMLFTLPTERTEILHAKWLGSILRFRLLGYALATVWVFGLCTGSFHPLAAVLLAAALLVHVAFLASLGIWLSLVCRNTLWSNMTMALMLLLIFVGSWIATSVDDRSAVVGLTNNRTVAGTVEVDWVSAFYQVGLNPVRTWWELGLSWDDVGNVLGPYDRYQLNLVSAALAGMAAFAALAGGLALLANHRFRREITRGR